VTAINQYKAFAVGDGALTLTPEIYAAITALQQGFQNGVADPQEFNTLARQVSVVAAMIGQFIADKSGLDAEDNGNVAELEARFIAALTALIREIGGPNAIHFADVDTGTANAVVATLTPAITSYAKPCIVLFKKGSADNSGTGGVTVNFNSVGVVGLKDQSAANFDNAALKGNSFYLAMFDGGNFRVLGGSTSYTNVTGLTANGGKMVDFNGTTGVIDLNISKGVHVSPPVSADMWPRERASDGEQVFLTSDELLAWINAHITPAAPADPWGPQVGAIIHMVGVPLDPNSVITSQVLGVVLTAAEMKSGKLLTGPAFQVLGLQSGFDTPYLPADKRVANNTLVGRWEVVSMVCTGKDAATPYNNEAARHLLTLQRIPD